MSDGIPLYRERLPAIAAQVALQGSQGLLVIDLSSLASVEDEYGTEAFDQVRQRVSQVLVEQRGHDYRHDDLLTLEEPRGLRFLLFLSRRRGRASASCMADLHAVRNRFLATLVPALGRAGFPYARAGTRIDVGYGMAVHNPLVHVERSLRRAVRDAMEQAENQRHAEELLTRERVQDILLGGRLRTSYQAILRMADHSLLGFEALSRGPRGSGLEPADLLFEAATRHRLLVEMDRLCRSQALLNSGRIPTNAKLFVNTLPATIRDPQFRDKPLIEFLQRAQVSPERIVLEITEKLVIDNYPLFREAMDYYSALGMSFAVDDVGAGYSGLESIARLKPAYLKVDIALVRDVHVNLVNREMVKAIIALGRGIGASVIAEGIQTEEEAVVLRDMGAEYGQGFLLARPDAPPD